jgi:hypothetical protein
MFDTLNKQQQPYIQSGYGAMSRLNTLLGLGGGSGAPGGGAPAPGPAYRPTPSGGIDQRIPSPVPQGPSAQGLPQNMRLKQILALRAQNGDTEAARMLGQV